MKRDINEFKLQRMHLGTGVDNYFIIPYYNVKLLKYNMVYV